MARLTLYRNARASDLLESFLVAAIASVLLVRFFLYLTHYPQIGGSGFHIAHMLWGGFLMMTALVMMFSFLGHRSQALAAAIGGFGFGMFIDELGKFITSDNNYFFQPTVGLIYAIFILMYLVFSFLGRRRPLTPKEATLNALAQLEEAAAQDLDPAERRQAQELLAQTDQSDPLVHALQQFLRTAKTVPRGQPDTLTKLLELPQTIYAWTTRQRYSNYLVELFFVSETLILLAGLAVLGYSDLKSAFQAPSSSTYQTWLTFGQLIFSTAAVALSIIGAFKLSSSRLQAYEYFRRAVLVNIFLTEFFVFARLQFGALPSFIFQLLLLLIIRYGIAQERRLTAPMLK